jgi:hypothetical protein
MGYHLPGFDDSQWGIRTPFKGLDTPGVSRRACTRLGFVLTRFLQVGWFRASFDLNLPEGHDVPISLAFADTPGAYRGS